MTRTTIMLPEDLKLRVRERARERGIPFAEFVRRALEARLGTPGDRLEEDPLFAEVPVFDGPAPVDLAAEHDKYLYEDHG